jgi:hypothetical protein
MPYSKAVYCSRTTPTILKSCTTSCALPEATIPVFSLFERDNNPKRDLDEKGIVRALGKLLAAGVPVADQFTVLNHWR